MYIIIFKIRINLRYRNVDFMQTRTNQNIFLELHCEAFSSLLCLCILFSNVFSLSSSLNLIRHERNSNLDLRKLQDTKSQSSSL